MILPFAKLGTLVLRTLSKPLASRLKSQAAHHPRFRQAIVNFAQSNHKFQVNIQRRIYGHATDVEIRPLNEEKAVQAASDLLGEAVIFSVGGGVVIFEVQRGAKSDARKEEARKAEIEDLRQQLAALALRLEKVEGAAPGSRGFSSWPLHNSRESKYTQTMQPETGSVYRTVNLSANPNLPKGVPTQPV